MTHAEILVSNVYISGNLLLCKQRLVKHLFEYIKSAACESVILLVKTTSKVR